MKVKGLAICTALFMALVFGACENTNSNSNANANANMNANMATPAATPTATPANDRASYSEREAQQEREKAKASKETIGDTLDDAWIHTKIVAKLIANSTTPERKINVDVVKNVVTLRGTVDTAEEKAAAEKTAKDTDGVTKVVNQLKVAPAAKATPKQSGKSKPNY
ncbi:MAG TPA: BON domain-containing protein [Pyrinomonadaceae bacterium]|jgi:osmotically-inducible protein OsmY|nr:BON domain-containing protein [Pyrinomonadaceae bacterium]